MTRFRAVSLLALLAFASLPAAANDLYGKPLRGLSAVPIGELAKAPSRFRDKAIRVEGTAASGSSSEVTLSEAGASLVVKAEGFTLPPKLAGARVVAEGRVKGTELVASGVEVSR